MSTKFRYKKEIVLFLDLLGFKELVKDEKRISSFAAIFGSVNQLNLFDLPMIHMKDTRFTSFSDSIVISTPCKKAGFAKIMRSMAVISNILLEAQILFRGAITCGKLYHEDNIVFGPALVDAYQLEESAVYPRCLIEEETLEICLRTCTEIEQRLIPERFHRDEDRMLSYDYMYDYFRMAYYKNVENPEALQRSIMGIKDMLEKEEQRGHSLKVMMKYKWLRNYYARTLDKLKEDFKIDIEPYQQA